ncbi:hypothetical protein FHS72_003550 [Loktanella ponticola]|uniref:Uncharacterized protein n=1 Tax=Yoonia ponticola TaxID=1524255 RepID=A0A7W9BNT4_9RHOB|nr:hypothetical protein [Yoonia ponticola]MBB5723903.1 hypothetical protein [Yoonia ponticola]
MTDHFVEIIQSSCSQEIAVQVEEVAVSSPDFSTLAKVLLQRASLPSEDAPMTPECFAAFVGHSAARLGMTSTDEALRTVLNASLSVSEQTRPIVLNELCRLYERMPLRRVDARTYFKPLSLYKIDVRPLLAVEYESLVIEEPQDDAFYYAYYLASISDPRGIKLLDDAAIRSEGEAHQLIGMLGAIAELGHSNVRFILERYSADDRRGVGVNGPNTGPSVAEVVTNELQYRVWN